MKYGPPSSSSSSSSLNSFYSATDSPTISLNSLGMPNVSPTNTAAMYYSMDKYNPAADKITVTPKVPPIQMEEMFPRRKPVKTGMNVKDLIGMKGLPRGTNIALLNESELLDRRESELHRRTQLNPIQRVISNTVSKLPNSFKPYASTALKGVGALGLAAGAAGIGHAIYNAFKKKDPERTGFKKGGRVPKSGKYLVHKKEFIVKKEIIK